MGAEDRWRREQAYHDAEAAARARTFAGEPDRLRFNDDDYLNHEPWVRRAMDRLGPVAGRRVLDWGCGHGMAAVVLARRGAIVTACDLSSGYVREAQARAAANGAGIDCLQANGERLPIADAAFDAVWGHAILHHLDVPRAAAELRRVLRPDGVAVLCEPWNGNPLLRLAREWRWTGRHTVDEAPLDAAALRKVRAAFPALEVDGVQLFSMLARSHRPSGWQSFLARSDARILERWPALQRLARYVVLVLRPGGPGLSRVFGAVP